MLYMPQLPSSTGRPAVQCAWEAYVATVSATTNYTFAAVVDLSYS
jgi:hypothetical protein